MHHRYGLNRLLAHAINHCVRKSANTELASIVLDYARKVWLHLYPRERAFNCRDKPSTQSCLLLLVVCCSDEFLPRRRLETNWHHPSCFRNSANTSSAGAVSDFPSLR